MYESGSFVNRFFFLYSLFTLRPHIIVYSYKLLKYNFSKYETYRKNINKTLNTEIDIFFIKNLYLASSIRLLLQTSKLSLFNQIALKYYINFGFKYNVTEAWKRTTKIKLKMDFNLEFV